MAEQDYAPTTLPSHLLALLTAPSPRAIIIILEEFDLFTEHARQALLYCLCTHFVFSFAFSLYITDFTLNSRRGPECQDWSH